MDLSPLKNIKTPYRLPNTYKLFFMILTFGFTLVFGVLLLILPLQDELQLLINKEMDLRNEFIDKKKQAVNLNAHKKQLQEIEVAFGTLLRQLPDKSEMDALLNDVNQAGVGQGLSFNLFKPAPMETMSEYYAEQPVVINVNGSFIQFGAFAEEVSKLSRIVHLEDVVITNKNSVESSYAGKPPELSVNAVVRTYRYLEQSEIDAQKKKTKSKKKK